MRAIRTFLQAGWGCSGGYHHLDEDEGKYKETDLMALRILEHTFQDGKELEVYYQIIAEVKKSEKPWIVFKESFEGRYRPSDAWNNLISTNNVSIYKSKLSRALRSGSLYSILNWKGYSIHESFKKPDTHSRWYAAFVSVCQAAEHMFANIEQQGFGEYELTFIKPVVILDGILVAASLTEGGELLLEEVQFAPFEFLHKFKKSDRKVAKDRYRVDVVTLSSLSEYIKISETRQEDILKSLATLLESKSAESGS